jgi:hypothetical protein
MLGLRVGRRKDALLLRWLASSVGLCVWLWSLAVHGQDRFEVQVYDSQTAGTLNPGLETHWNFSARGTQEPATEGELPTHHVTRLTFEPHLGLSELTELGAYFQTAQQPGGAYEFAGLKLRFKIRYPRKLDGFLGLAVNFELSGVPSKYEANVWGGEVRPIADVRWHRLYAAINPILSLDFKGSYAGRPQLEPAAKVGIDAVPASLQLGAEYYGGLGPVTGLFAVADQTHNVFGVIDFTSSYVDINFGIGYGLAAGDRWIVKSIIGFHPKP